MDKIASLDSLTPEDRAIIRRIKSGELTREDFLADTTKRGLPGEQLWDFYSGIDPDPNGEIAPNGDETPVEQPTLIPPAQPSDPTPKPTPAPTPEPFTEIDTAPKALQEENLQPPGAQTPASKLAQKLQSRLKSADDLIQQALNPERPPLQYLPLLGQPGFFVRGFSHLLAAYPKTGKTTLLLECVQEWSQAGYSILYITEESELLWEERVRAQPRLKNLEQGSTNFLFALGLSRKEILEDIKNGKEEIVIIDTLKLLGIEDENDNAKVNKALSPFIQLCREQKKTSFLTHHTTKRGGDYGKATAGGYAFTGLPDTFLELFRDGKNPNKRLVKGIGRLTGEVSLLYEQQGDSLIPQGTPNDYAKDSVKERLKTVLLKAWQTTSDLKAALGIPAPSADVILTALTEMAKAGEIDRDPPLSEGNQQGKTCRWRRRGGRVIPWEVIPDEPTLEEQIFASLDQAPAPLSPPALANLLNKDVKTIRNALKSLVERGEVQQIPMNKRGFLYQTDLTGTWRTVA